jgi:tRNA(fMet)-specific endonuclease VapC
MRLLDTNTATLLYYDRPSVVEHWQNTKRVDTVALPIVAYAELLRGRLDALIKAKNASDVERMQRFLLSAEAFVEQFEIVQFDAVALEHLTRLTTAKATRSIGLPDLLIASIALAQDATLVTRNTKDFNKVPNLKLENWAD